VSAEIWNWGHREVSVVKPPRITVLVEAHDEWEVADQRYLSETTVALLNRSDDQPDQHVAVPAALTA
jgi:hypothetical protein